MTVLMLQAKTRNDDCDLNVRCIPPEQWPGRSIMSPDPSSPNYCRDAQLGYPGRNMLVVHKPEPEPLVVHEELVVHEPEVVHKLVVVHEELVVHKRPKGDRHKNTDARRAYRREWMTRHRAALALRQATGDRT